MPQPGQRQNLSLLALGLREDLHRRHSCPQLPEGTRQSSAGGRAEPVWGRPARDRSEQDPGRTGPDGRRDPNDPFRHCSRARRAIGLATNERRGSLAADDWFGTNAIASPGRPRELVPLLPASSGRSSLFLTPLSPRRQRRRCFDSTVPSRYFSAGDGHPSPSPAGESLQPRSREPTDPLQSTSTAGGRRDSGDRREAAPQPDQRGGPTAYRPPDSLRSVLPASRGGLPFTIGSNRPRPPCVELHIPFGSCPRTNRPG